MALKFSFRAALTFAAAFFAITALAPRAQAQPDLRGRSNGFSECHNNLVPAVQIVDSFFDVFTQARGRFMGEMEIHSGPAPHLFPVAGFVFPNGAILGNGRDAAGNAIAFVGRARAIGDPNILPPSPIVLMSLLYSVFDSRGNVTERGIMVHIQMQGGLNWSNPGPVSVPAVQGQWDGDYAPIVGPGGGCIEMDLAQMQNPAGGLTSSFMGGAHMDNVFVPAVQSFFDITYDVEGTVGVPAVQREGEMAAPFGEIGVCPSDPSRPGIIAILIGLLQPPNPNSAVPAVQGQYRLYDSFFDVFTEIALDRSTAFGHGAFMVQRRTN